jgi:nicotinamidase-related amidase
MGRRHAAVTSSGGTAMTMSVRSASASGRWPGAARPAILCGVRVRETNHMREPRSSRDRPIPRQRAALVVVDVQNGTCGAGASQELQRSAAGRVLPNIRRLLDGFRAAGLEVIYTVIENLTQDGRDRSLDYKLSEIFVAKGSWEAQVVAEVAPRRDEIVLPKTSSSPFHSTNLDYLLRNIGIEDVFVVGFLTDQCIDHTVKDGADRGYYMTCIHDACAAASEARHAAALECFAGYCRMLATADVLNFLATAQ